MKFEYTKNGFELIAETKRDKQWLMDNGFAKALICRSAGSGGKKEYNQYETRKSLIQLSLGEVYKFDIYESKPLTPQETEEELTKIYEKLYVDSKCRRCGKVIRVQKPSPDDLCWECGVELQ